LHKYPAQPNQLLRQGPDVRIPDRSYSTKVRFDQNTKWFPFRPIWVVLFLALAAAAFASDPIHGTIDEAKAMLLKAIAHYQSAGRKQALADFTAKKPPFEDRDLYVVCIDADHRLIANGAFPEAVGTSGDTLVDVDGKGVATAAWEVVRSKGENAVRYRWINPRTRNLELKTAFFAKVGDDVCGVGGYSPN